MAILDEKGDKVVGYGYDAWGKPLTGFPWHKEHETDGTLTSEYEAIANLNPFRYRGYVYDEETGLYYLRSRYYNPGWGRFINGDSVLGNEGDLLEHNVFCYCKNLPVICVDESGRRRAFINVYTKWGYYGHADITIMRDDGTPVTFSYGRYGDTWGPAGTLGEGILQVDNYGRSEEDMLHKRCSQVRIELNVTDEQINRIEEYYKNLSGAKGTVDGLPSKNKEHWWNEYKTKQQYNFLTSNCTTVVVDALRYALQDDMPKVWKNHTVPAFFLNDLLFGTNHSLYRGAAIKNPREKRVRLW